jgi:hypothetical protein
MIIVMMRGTLLLLLALTVLAAPKTDLYKVLGLERGVAENDIKKAFRRLSAQWHPDVNKDPEAKDKFIEIQRVAPGDLGARGVDRQAEETHLRHPRLPGSRRIREKRRRKSATRWLLRHVRGRRRHAEGPQHASRDQSAAQGPLSRNHQESHAPAQRNLS